MEMRGAVTLTCEPGILLFEFIYDDSDGDPVLLGTAVNLHTLLIEP